jgi:hypothetical protein
MHLIGLISKPPTHAEGNGRLLFQPKKGVEYLVLNVDILPYWRNSLKIV